MDESSTGRPSASDVLARAKELAAMITGDIADRAYEIPTAHTYVLGMFWRCVRLYDGVILLLEAQLPEEAAILGRSLFEESLRLQQLTDSSQRDALIVGWANR